MSILSHLRHRPAAAKTRPKKTADALPLAIPTLRVSVTTRCNFRCPHCMREMVDDNKLLTRDLAPEVLNTALEEGKKTGFSCVSFTGGEPILNPHFPRLVELAVKHGYRYAFTSNGWLYREYWSIIEKSRDALDRVVLSIDGITADVHDTVRNKPGSFERVRKALRFYGRNGIPLSCSFCVTRANQHQIGSIADMCAQYGVRSLKYATVMSLTHDDRYSLTEQDKLLALRQMLSAQKQLGDRISITSAACAMVGKASRYLMRTPHFCRMLNCHDLYIDHDGGMFFCCDIYRKCAGKPMIGTLGFARCLKLTFDVANELKKRHAQNLLNGSASKAANMCDLCNSYIEEALAAVSPAAASDR